MDDLVEELARELGNLRVVTAQPNVGDGDARSATKDDSCNPLNLLAEDAWLHVISFLDDDPRDLMNLADTCSYFKHLVETPRPVGYGAQREACRLEEVLPLIFKWLCRNWDYETKDILNLRLVCHRVGSTVDKILENGARITTHQNIGLFPKLLPILPLASERRCSFEFEHLRYDDLFYWPKVLVRTVQEIENFQKTRQSQTRRILGINALFVEVVEPKVYLSDEVLVADETILLKQLFEFLRAPGAQQIKNLFVNILPDTSLLNLYKFLHKLLELSPNLRCLGVDSVWDIRPTLHGEDYLDDEKQVLEEFTLDHHLPSTPNLERLQIIFRIPLPFIREIAEAYGSQLRYLHLDVYDRALRLTGSIPQFEFPVLEELVISASDICTAVALSFKAPSLKALTLKDGEYRCHEYDDSQRDQLKDLIEAIANFPLITTLRLENYIEVYSVSDEYFKPNAELRNLHVSGEGLSLSLQFCTKWFPNLEWVSVEMTKYEVEQDKDLKLLWEGQFQESLVWRETPTLGTVRLRLYSDRYKGGIWKVWRRNSGGS